MAGNYLIGRAELLAEPIPAPRGGGDKAHPYQVDQARERLRPQLSAAIEDMDRRVESAPDDVHVASFTLHPAYLAKSWYPDGLLRMAGLEAVGSRSRIVVPEAQVGDAEGEAATSELFVAGPRAAFRTLFSQLAGTAELPEPLQQIRRIEEISAVPARSKLVGEIEGADTFELVLHLPSAELAPDNQAEFLARARDLGFQVRGDLTFRATGLWFLPATGPADRLEELAEYATVRLIRPMPQIVLAPVTRLLPSEPQIVRLPAGGAASELPRVAILDGGLPESHPLGPWIESYREMAPEAAGVPGNEEHGLAVASAFLFGPLASGVPVPTPPAHVSVIRVLDSTTGQGEDPFSLYRTLGHIEDILLSRSFDFINLSLGPNLPMDDDEVHAWTAVIDELLSDGDIVMTVAVGNNGEMDRESGNARVQVPGDAVNALAVGAADRLGHEWARAPYSAFGPGRSPGRVKPDLLGFGGSRDEPFNVLAPAAVPTLSGQAGTSLSAPLVLRQAASVRATIGPALSNLAIRTLLIHVSDDAGHDRSEVGWGRLPLHLDDIITVGDGVARIVYQGEIKPGKFIRANIPTPAGGLTGRIEVTATFAFASPVDPNTPNVYTRAALEPVFRPNLNKMGRGSSMPASRPFFSPAAFAPERELRAQDGKWENVLHASQRFNGSTLVRPVFDIHYNARDAGAPSRAEEALAYALIITVRANRHVNLHNEILAAYPGILVPIEPDIQITLPGA